jgi:hypothetical protein
MRTLLCPPALAGAQHSVAQSQTEARGKERHHESTRVAPGTDNETRKKRWKRDTGKDKQARWNRATALWMLARQHRLPAMTALSRGKDTLCFGRFSATRNPQLRDQIIQILIGTPVSEERGESPRRCAPCFARQHWLERSIQSRKARQRHVGKSDITGVAPGTDNETRKKRWKRDTGKGKQARRNRATALWMARQHRLPAMTACIGSW